VAKNKGEKMTKSRHIKPYHRLKIISTKEVHDSGYQVLKVYGCRSTVKGYTNWNYIGSTDAVHIYYGKLPTFPNSMETLVVDSQTPGSIFEIAGYCNTYKLESTLGIIQFIVVHEQKIEKLLKNLYQHIGEL
jgi:hypothetical protein